MAFRIRAWNILSCLLVLLLVSPGFVTGHTYRKLLQCTSPAGCRQPAGSLQLAWGTFISSVVKPGSSQHPSNIKKPAAAPSDIQLTQVGGLPISSSVTPPGPDTSQLPSGESGESREPTLHRPLDAWITETTLPSSPPVQPTCRTIPQEVQRYANLVILSKALKVSGLSKILQDPSTQVTLFAPTDLAFETLAEKRGQTVDDLLEDDKYLRDVLDLHVAREALTTSDLKRSQSVDTRLTGYPLLITSSSTSSLVVPPKGDPANIQLRDILACNSVIHIIDHVLTHAEDRNLGIFAG